MADNLVQKATASTGELLSHLAAIQNNLSEAEAFINLMGWELPPGLEDIGLATIDIGDFVQKLNAVTGAPNEVWEDEIAMLERIIDLTLAINNLVTAINTLSNELPVKLASFGDYVDRTNIHKEFPRRLFDFLLTNYLAKSSPISYAVLHLLNIIDYPHFDADHANFQVEHIRATINYHHFKTLFTDPGKLAEEAYGWNTPEYDSTVLLQRIQLLFQALGMRSRLSPLDKKAEERWTNSTVTDTVPMPQLSAFLFEERGAIAGIRIGLSIFGTRPTTPGGSDGGIGMVPIIRGQVQGSIPLFRFEDTFLDFAGEADLLKSIAITLRPNKDLSISRATNFTDAINARFAIGFRHGSAESDAKTLLAFPGGMKVQYKSMGVMGGVENKAGKAQSFMELSLLGCGATFSLSEADGFMRKTVSKDKIESSFDIKIGWTSIGGIYFEGSGALEISIPTYISIGPIRLEAVILKLGTGDDDLQLEASASVRATLGPITAIVNRIGLNVGLSFGSGNLGIFGLDPRFKPPSGIGLTVDAGGIKGGGILDFNPDKAEYFGALELEFKDLFSLKAFGIINTKMPDGSKNFSLLIVITAEFTPIQLGFGFTLNGVGGLLGVNRTTRVEVLKEGVKTNTLKSILFPEDVVANINRIVSDIKQVFPPQDDHLLICPMGKLGWGTPTILTLELGILIEIPATGFKILGVLKALLPEENSPLLKLQVNFLGIIDFENKFISFDASLYDSSILTFTLTGDMALRLGFGDKPMFLLSVGGFHPAFKEIPDDLKSMRRITISLYDSENARIIIQSYFAVTSNTAQFGAKAELFAKKGSFNIYGFVGYDVLFQFIPFKFIADFGAGVALRRNTSVIMSIHVSGQLSGPKPWDAKGEASVSFFFFSVSVPFHVTWGDPNNEAAALKEDILVLLQAAINDNRNWKAEIPVNNKLLVSIRTIPESSMAVHPFGILSFSERLVPLEIEIKKYGNKLPKDANRFEIKVNDTQLKTDEAREPFAPANFFEMKDSEKLARPSFELMKSGFKISGSSQLKAPPHIVKKPVDYEFSYLGKTRKPKPDKYKYPGVFFKAGTKSAAASQAVLSHQNNRVSVNAPAKIVLREEQYVIANVSDMKLFSEKMKAASYTEALQHYNELIIQKPELKDQVQVLAEYELN